MRRTTRTIPTALLLLSLNLGALVPGGPVGGEEIELPKQALLGHGSDQLAGLLG